jgi:uncharacterized protein (DUF1810 family)
MCALMTDQYNLQRFVDAQNPIYDRVRGELRRGQKTSHWMWFIFPQLTGLGHSDMAMRFGISSKEEAEEYLRHSVLGRRLIECARLVSEVEGRSIEQIFGYPDNLKFHSSMTLFLNTTMPNPVMQAVLDKYFGGKVDQLTLEKLSLLKGQT